jgi:hypothetical protein
VSIAEILSHPLSLLLIGAIVSGLLIPYFTNRWQRHQKGLEIRIDLVRRISRTIMSIMTMIDSPLKTESSEKLVEDLHKEIREFQVDRGIIGTELHGYFPSEDCPENIGDKWDRLGDCIEILIECMKDKKDSKETELGEVKVKTDIMDYIIEGIYDRKLEIILLVLKNPCLDFRFHYDFCVAYFIITHRQSVSPRMPRK